MAPGVTAQLDATWAALRALAVAAAAVGAGTEIKRGVPLAGSEYFVLHVDSRECAQQLAYYRTPAASAAAAAGESSDDEPIQLPRRRARSPPDSDDDEPIQLPRQRRRRGGGV